MTRWFAVRFLPALCTLALMLAAGGLLIAQETKTPPAVKPAPAAKPASNTKELQVLAERTQLKEVGKSWQTILTTATVTQEDSVFAAKTIVIESEKKVHTFTCTGNPVFTDPETRITADKVVGQSTPRWAEFTGNVKMVATPKKKEAGENLKGKLTGEPTTVTSSSLSYDYGKKVAQARCSVVVVQKNRTVWADQAVYEQKAELITMTGNIRMRNTGEEEVKAMKNADKVTVSLQEDWADILAKPGGPLVEFTLEYDDEEAAPAPKK